MGGWNDILKEVQETQSQYDYVRRKYIADLSIKTCPQFCVSILVVADFQNWYVL